MSSLDKAMQTQLDNIQKRTGKSLDQLAAIVKKSGLTKHGDIRDYLKRELGHGHGDANALVHAVLQSDGQRAAEGKASDQVLDEIYSEAKAHMRSIHEKLMQEINKFGEFEIAPKKGYVSLRRKKQFATVGPATKTEVEIGLNAKDERVAAVFTRLPPGGMCQYKTRIASVDAVDDALLAAIRIAYDEAG